MRTFKARRYLPCVLLFTAALIASWLVPNVFILNNIANDKSINLSDTQIFLNIMGSHGNYLSYNRMMALYLVAFIFALNRISPSDKPYYIIRLKSRATYIRVQISDAVKLALIFAVLIELINIAFSFAFFGFDLTLRFDLIADCACDFATEALFYIQVGAVLLIVGILTNRKIAPFLVFAFYFLQYFTEDCLPFLRAVWLPYKDCVQVTSLVMQYISMGDTVPIITRGIIINIALIFLAYFLFLRKDIMGHEKK